jgi:hypothetical protein
MQKVQIVILDTDGWHTHEVACDQLITWCEIRGYAHVGLTDAHPRHRAELHHQPCFAGLLGPMWNGNGLRYECPEAYRALSA